MSFDTLKIKELKEIAESFAVDVPTKISKQQLILLMEEEGVTYDAYKRFFEAEKVEPEPDFTPRPPKIEGNAPDVVLVKMDRGNFTFQAGNHVFTKQHPFIAMTANEAQSIFDSYEGFRLATPREAQEFYS
jgi:hypothetical protein